MFLSKIDDSLMGRAQDVLKAFESGAYISALCLALALPDICASRVRPNETCRNRYVWWFNTYAASTYQSNGTSESGVSPKPYFNGSDCYQLRCVFLHEGINALHIERKQTTYNIAQFRLFDYPGISCDHISEQLFVEKGIRFRHVDLDLNKFIHAIKDGVEKFVEEYPECNEASPIDGLWRVFYNPILDFRNS